MVTAARRAGVEARAFTVLRLVGTDARVLAAIVALALIPRLATLAQPLLEKHPFRQTWTAYTALLYHENGIDLLHPELPVFGPPFFHPQEFPLFQAVASLVMDAGIATDPALRVTALAMFVLTTIAVFVLVRHVAGSLAALIAAGFFVSTPFALVWSRASLIEYLATAGTIAYVFWGVRYRDTHRWSYFALALAAGVVGVLVKPTTGVFCAIPIALYDTRAGWPGLRAWIAARLDIRLAALGIGPGALALAWTAMADAYLKSKPAAAFLAPSNLRDYFLDLSVGRGNVDLWGLIASRFAYWVVGVPFLPVLALGLVVAWRSRARPFWIGLALAAVMPVLVFYGGYRRHDYYQIAISPEIAMFVGLGGASLVAWSRRRIGRAGPSLAAAAALLAFAYVYATTADYWRPIYEPIFDSEQVLPAARELATYSDADDLVVMLGRGFDPDVLYYARRKGLLLTFENGSESLYRRLPALPYRVFFSWDPSHDSLEIMRWWAWNGAVGPRTYEIGADPLSLRRSVILATDDIGAYDAAAARGRALATTLAVPCDGSGREIPADPQGTWLRVSAPPGTTVSLDLLEGPLPVRAVFVLTPQVLVGRSSFTASCVGPGSFTIERVVAAPPPTR